MSNKSLWQNLSFMDTYGSKVELLFNNKKEHSTIFGGLITLSNIIILIFVIISYGSELFKKDKPITIYSEETIKQPEIYNMTSSLFSMSFGLQDPSFNHFIDETIYSIKAIQTNMFKVFNQQTQKFEQQWESVDIGPFPCKKELFKVPGTEDFYKELVGLDQMYCFDQTENKSWIGGDFSADLFGFIEFSIHQCRNKTESEAVELQKQGKKVILCKSQDQIDSILSGAFFAAYFTDKVINPKNLDNPYLPITRDIFWPVSNKLVKELTMYMRNIYIQSDVGLMQEDVKIQRDVTFSYSTEQVIYGQSDQFVHLVIRFEKSKQARYFRSYVKVEDILAQISGVMDFVVILSSFICLKISQLDLSKQLVNEVFSFQSIDEESEFDDHLNQKKEKQDEIANKVIKKITDHLNNSKLKKQSIEMKNQFSQNEAQTNIGDDISKSLNRATTITRKKQQSEILSSFIKNYKQNIQSNQIKSDRDIKQENKFKSHIDKLFKVSNSVLRLKSYEYILYYIFPCWKQISKKKRQIDMTKKCLDKHLDVLYLVNKFQEVDKLKMLLLSDDQIKLFNYLPKPTIKENDLIVNKNNVKQRQLNNQSDSIANQNDSLEISSANQPIKYKNNSIDKFNLLYMDERSDIEKASDAFCAFENLRKQKNRSSIDIKLLQMLDPKILDYFLDEKGINSLQDTMKEQSELITSSGFTGKLRNKILSHFSSQNINKSPSLQPLKLSQKIDSNQLLQSQSDEQKQQQQIYFSNNELLSKQGKYLSQPNMSFKYLDKVQELEESKQILKDSLTKSKINNNNNSKIQEEKIIEITSNNSEFQENQIIEHQNMEDNCINNKIKSDYLIPSEQVSPLKSQRLLPNSTFNDMKLFQQNNIKSE